jgi:hypothetical protein
VFDVLDAGGIQAVSPCLGIGDEPPDGLIDVGSATDEPLGTPGQDDARP